MKNRQYLGFGRNDLKIASSRTVQPCQHTETLLELSKNGTTPLLGIHKPYRAPRSANHSDSDDVVLLYSG